MSEHLVTEKVYPEEADTVEGRLADLMESAEVKVEDYLLSDVDRAKVVSALREVHARTTAQSSANQEAGTK